MSETGDGEEDGLLAVCMTCEAHVKDTARDACLGVVSVPRCAALTVSQLRARICAQVSRLPPAFTFLTTHGGPISKCQETSIKVSQIVTDAAVRIQKYYEKPRVGIRVYGGAAIGFVFIDVNCSVHMLRQALQQQLGQYVSFHDGGWYQFIDRNGWPVNRDQEGTLSVLDILDDASVQLTSVPLAGLQRTLAGADQTDGNQRYLVGNGDSSVGSMDAPAMSQSVDSVGNKRRSVPILRPCSTFGRVKDKEVARPSNLLEPKQILISYVRAEAAQHALMLKETLTQHGYSVYLDVHEIKSGIDWQDALNFAVSNCQVFVPLVTPRYGETVWTNREVKLADVLKKYIVPISFLDHWPPKCLAIQFATTQYIPWKTLDIIKQGTGPGVNPGRNHSAQEAGQIARANDTRFWESEHVERVAEQIESQVTHHDESTGQIPKLTQMVSTLKSCPVSLPDDMAQLAAQDREGKPLVVISIHPQQKAFGNKLKALLEDQDYEVWCSSELSQPPNGVDESSEDSAGTPTMPGNCFSLMSQMSQDSTELNPVEKECRLQFQRKADEAGVVIFVLSKVFAASRTSKQQVFYCEHRKRVIPLRYEEFCMPGWMSMLIGTGVFEDARAEGFEESLKARVKRCLDPTARAGSENDVNEAKIKCHVHHLRKRIPRGVSVYISGGTRFYHKDSEKICQAIGEHLARLEDLQIVTGGFFGVGDKVGRSYNWERQKLEKTCNIWHVLPERDDQDRRKQAQQNVDKTFPMVDYGKTVYSGDSVREREVIVSRVFDICILVEGGPGAAHEAEQFCWNDHVVIPVKITGGAACGKFNVPDKIFKIPPGVSEEDWRMLDKKGAVPDRIGRAVSNIVSSIKERLKLDSPTFTYSASPLTSPSTPGPLTPGRDVTVTSPAATSPRRRRPSLTKMKTVRLPSQTSFCFRQSRLPGDQQPETDAVTSPEDAVPNRKRKLSDADL